MAARQDQPRVRFIAGPRNADYDRFITRLVREEGYGRERQYFGIEEAERAEKVRRGMRQAGRQLGISVRAYWKECGGCTNGGPNCRFHVHYAAFSPAAAKAYRAEQQRLAGSRGGKRRLPRFCGFRRLNVAL